MFRKSLAVCLAGFLLFAGMLVGCQGAAKKPATPQQNTPAKTGNMDVSASERRVMASRLSKVVQNVQGVEKATVVVTDGMSASQIKALVVLVGLTVKSDIKNDPGRINTLKKTVAERIKADDNRITQVLITTDSTMIKRINDVAAGIIEGKPIQTYETNVDNLARDLKKKNEAF